MWWHRALATTYSYQQRKRISSIISSLIISLATTQNLSKETTACHWFRVLFMPNPQTAVTVLTSELNYMLAEWWLNFLITGICTIILCLEVMEHDRFSAILVLQCKLAGMSADSRFRIYQNDQPILYVNSILLSLPSKCLFFSGQATPDQTTKVNYIHLSTHFLCCLSCLFDIPSGTTSVVDGSTGAAVSPVLAINISWDLNINYVRLTSTNRNYIIL